MKILLALCLQTIFFPAYATVFNINSKIEFEELSQQKLISSCSSNQSSELQSFSSILNNSLDINLSKWNQYNLIGVKNIYVIPENRIWNETNPKHLQYSTYWQNIQKNLVAMSIDSKKGIDFQCSLISDKRCQNGVIAYVVFLFNRPIKTIHLCPIFWQQSNEEKSSTLFHELSHYSASTFDYAGDWWQGKDNIDVVRGSMDAYHLQEFYTASPESTLKRMIWYWFWPKK